MECSRFAFLRDIMNGYEEITQNSFGGMAMPLEEKDYDHLYIYSDLKDGNIDSLNKKKIIEKNHILWFFF